MSALSILWVLSPIPPSHLSPPFGLVPASATFFAAMDPDGMHLGNVKTAKIFIKNFFQDFKAILGKGHVIKTFEKCDFEPIRQHLNEQKIIRKAISDQERKANKEDRNKVMFKFGYALVDGHLEKVGNFNMVSNHSYGKGIASCDVHVCLVLLHRNLQVPFVAVVSTQRWASSNLVCSPNKYL